MHCTAYSILKGFRHIKQVVKKSWGSIRAGLQLVTPIFKRSFQSIAGVFGDIGRSIVGPPAKTPEEIKSEQAYSQPAQPELSEEDLFATVNRIDFEAENGEPNENGHVIDADLEEALQAIETTKPIFDTHPSSPVGLSELHDFEETDLSHIGEPFAVHNNPFTSDGNPKVEFTKVDIGDEREVIAILSPPDPVMDRHLPMTPFYEPLEKPSNTIHVGDILNDGE